MSKEVWRLLSGSLLLVVVATAHAQGIAVTASHSEANLDWLYPPERIESACGDDLFAVEATVTAARRVCLRRDLATGRYEIVGSAKIDQTGWLQVVRGPTTTDRSIWLWSPPSIVRYDPVTDARSELVRFSSPEPVTPGAPLIFDREGDGELEVFLPVAGASEIRSLDSGERLATLTGIPWNVSGLTVVPGRFDADPAAEFAVFEPIGMRVYDAVTLQIQGPAVSTQGVQTVRILGPLDWDADGRDEFIYVSAFAQSFALVDFDADTVPRFVVGPPGAGATHMRAVQWVGDALPELALIWFNRAMIYDPRSNSVVHQQPLGDSVRPHQLLGFESSGAGGPAMLWNTPSRLVRWEQGSPPAAVQEALIRIMALRGPTGRGGTDAQLLTGEARTPSSGVSFGWFSRRDPTTLRPLQSKQTEVVGPLTMAIGQLRAEPGDELLVTSPSRVAVSDFSSFPFLWGLELSPFQPERIGPAALTQRCVGAACDRALVAFNAATTASAGSYLGLYGSSGELLLWTSARDNCLGCDFRAVALEDVDGDGEPDLMSSKRELSPTRTTVVLRDGATRTTRWSRDFSFSQTARQLVVAGDARRRIVAVVDDSSSGPVTLHWLDADDGTTRRARALPAGVQRIAYLPYDAERGAWLLLGDPTRVWVIDADLRGGMRALNIDEIEQGAGGEPGVAYLASRHTVYRVTVPADTLFIDEFEAF